MGRVRDVVKERNMYGKTLAALAAALTITGCTTNPYTGEQQASKTNKYFSKPR